MARKSDEIPTKKFLLHNNGNFVQSLIDMIFQCENCFAIKAKSIIKMQAHTPYSKRLFASEFVCLKRSAQLDKHPSEEISNKKIFRLSIQTMCRDSFIVRFTFFFAATVAEQR